MMVRATAKREEHPTRLIPTDRISHQLLPLLASEFAELATKLMPLDSAAGIRLALEAHFMFAGASKMQVRAMRYNLHIHGPVWARLLLTCSRRLAESGDFPMALDTAAWAGATAEALAPLFPIVGQEARQLVKECFRHNGQMLIDNGRHEVVREWLKAAESPWTNIDDTPST